jgi:uncharacterized protein
MGGIQVSRLQGTRLLGGKATMSSSWRQDTGNIPQKVLDEIKAIGYRHGVKRIVLFGSRARGDFHKRSDIDLAVFTIPDPLLEARIKNDMEDLPTLLKVDVVFMRPSMDVTLQKNVEREGAVLYE